LDTSPLGLCWHNKHCFLLNCLRVPYLSLTYLQHHYWSSFNKSHFFIFIYEYIVFPPYSPSYTLSLYLPPPPRTNPHTGPVLPSCSFFEKKKKDIFVCLRLLYRCFILTFPCIYIKNLNWFIPSVFLLSTLVLFLW
jgi:hypothetical protein